MPRRVFDKFNFSYCALHCVGITLCRNLGVKVNGIAQLVITLKLVTASGSQTVLKLCY